MVKAEFVQTPGGALLQIKGHADHQPGNDIVCSACSALAYTFAGAMNGISGGVSVHLKDLPGDYICRVVFDSEQRQECETVFRTILTGFQQIAQTYPQNVQVSVTRSKV